jgi:hypothetical protein
MGASASHESENLDRVGFVIVQAGKGLSCQCDLGNVVQFLWLCWHAGVPARHVRAFLQHGLSDEGEVWPEPHFPPLRSRPLVPPSGYADSIVFDRTNLVEKADDAIWEFAKDRGVARIVFIYVNHGPRESLDVPQDSPPFVAETFLRWCQMTFSRRSQFFSFWMRATPPHLPDAFAWM